MSGPQDPQAPACSIDQPDPAIEGICEGLWNQLSLFRFLEHNELCPVASRFCLKKFAAGETLWREDDPADYAAILVEGKVEIRKGMEFKDSHIVLAVFDPGSLVGELSLLDDEPRAVTAVALEDVTLLALSGKALEALIADHPGLGNRLLKGMLLTVSIRLRRAYERLAALF